MISNEQCYSNSIYHNEISARPMAEISGKRNSSPINSFSKLFSGILGSVIIGTCIPGANFAQNNLPSWNVNDLRAYNMSTNALCATHAATIYFVGEEAILLDIKSLNTTDSTDFVNWSRLEAMSIFGEMRDLNEEENKLYHEMLKQKSRKTGVNFSDFL